MVKKNFLLSLGERTTPPEDTDELLRRKSSESKRREIERQEERDEAKHEAEMAKYRKEAATASAAADKSGEKKDESGGFKVDGRISLGQIDYQQILNEQMAERDRLRQEAEQAAAHQQQVSDDLREKLHASEIEVLKTSFNAQMQILTKMIEQGTSKGTFNEQLAAAQEIANQLGFQKVTPNGGDAMVQIELRKLDFEHDKMMKDMARADKAEERRFQMEIRRLDDEREDRKAKLENERKKLEMLNNAPKVLGEAVGLALLAGGGENAPSSTRSKPAQQYELPVPVGHGGTTHCPECETEVGVGPTARTAICAKCGTKISIKRIQVKGPPETETSEENEE